MSKKLLTLCMALVAFAALALPAVAAASPELGETLEPEKWTKAEVGHKILATQLGSSKLTETSGGLLLECSTGTMTGELTKNSGTEIEGKITSATFGGTGQQATGEPAPECTGATAFGNASVTPVVSEKAPWCISSKGEDKFSVNGGACPGTGTVKFKMATTLVGTCEYESTGTVSGTYNTEAAGDAVLTIGSSQTQAERGFKLISGVFGCPTSGVLDMQFTLETDGTPNSPLYIR